jgi:hypothetical protein
MADAMDRQLAAQTLAWCDQIEQALQEGDQDLVDQLRGKIVFHFAHAEEADIRVAVECARARAEQVLKEP